jgi:flagellar basal-body rod modification protein FlgD
MAIPAINPAVTSTVASATTGSATAVDSETLAKNFSQFLTLLTTQLKNQNPLDPLDTNQFTQQLVQFAQVEQQLKQNDQLATLVSLQKTAQSTAALGFVGETVVVDGSTASLANGQANWSLNVPKPATVMINIRNSTGQNVFSGSYTMLAGVNDFTWDGKSTNGTQWPSGNYTMTVTAKDTSGQSIAVPTEVEGVVNSADLTKNPPVLSVAGQDFTLDKVKRVVRH